MGMRCIHTRCLLPNQAQHQLLPSTGSSASCNTRITTTSTSIITTSTARRSITPATAWLRRQVCLLTSLPLPPPPLLY
jgi:hypothetical protein